MTENVAPAGAKPPVRKTVELTGGVEEKAKQILEAATPTMDQQPDPDAGSIYDQLASGTKGQEPTLVDQLQAEVSEMLSDWWADESTADMLAAVPKAIEYGSTDLEAMGVQLVALHPNVEAMNADERSRVGLEMAIAFYLLGKATRIFGAYQRGGVPSDDTWHDLTVYSMMARRVRETGGWPGVG